MKKLFLLALFLLTACQRSVEPSERTTTATSPTDTETSPTEPQQELVKPEFFTAQTVSLSDYLEKPIMEEKVYELWKKGHENYQEGKPLSVARKKGGKGGGRSGDWIFNTLGQDENSVKNELKDLNPPPTWSIEEIDNLYAQVTAGFDSNNAPAPSFNLVRGLSVNYLQDAPMGKNAIVQLASQYNYLESPGSHVIAVSQYLGDNTQGPQGVIEALAATLFRDAMVNNDKLAHALKDILEENNFYKNGYLMLYNATEVEKTNLLTKINASIKKLRILPQWVLCEPTGALQLQVFSAAPSFQGAAQPSIESDSGQICNELVSAQYEAIGKLAVIRAHLTNKIVPINLTLVGQSAFNNPPEVMRDSFAKLAKVVKGHDKVKVFIHAFGSDAADKVKKAHENSQDYSLTEMSKEKFMALTPEDE